MIYLSIYSIDAHIERQCSSIKELAGKLGVTQKQLKKEREIESYIAELCGGHAVLLPKKVADDLRRNSGHYGV
jgi:hypothetical protein